MDSHISELTRNRRFKDAQKALTKRLKKSPDDLALLITQADLSLASGELQDCKKQCTSLCTRNPPIFDYASLDCVYTIACTLSARRPELKVMEASTLWQKATGAAAKKSHQFDLAQEWASLSIKYEQWNDLAKAALTLQRQFAEGSVERRQYWLWQITAYCLAGIQADGLERTMAVKLLQKAFADISSLPESEIVRSDTDLAELRLIGQTLLSLGKKDELAKNMAHAQIHNKSAGLEVQRLGKMMYSGTALHQWARDRLNDALKHNQMHIIDDWGSWSALLSSTGIRPDGDPSSGTNGVETRLHEIINLIDCGSKAASGKLRAPHLARLRFVWDHPEDSTGAQLSETLRRINLFTDYFKAHSKRRYATEDLCSLSQEFRRPQFITVRDNIAEYMSAPNTGHSQLDWVISETLSLELDFHYLRTGLLKQPIGDESRACQLLEALACSCVRLYFISLTHTVTLPEKAAEPGDAACILAAKVLLLLGTIEKSSTRQIQALCLLSFLISQSKYNSDARLACISTALSAGLSLTAWEAYKGLDVKKILHEKLSPKMFVDISILQPFALPQFDAYDAMKTPLNFYEQSLMEVPEYQELALQSGNYAGVGGMRDFVQRLRHSPSRATLIYERRRIARLNHVTYDRIESVPDVQPFPMASPIPARAVPSSVEKLADSETISHLNWLVAIDAAIEAATASTHEQVDKLQQSTALFHALHARHADLTEFGRIWAHDSTKRHMFNCCQLILDILAFMMAVIPDFKVLIGRLNDLQMLLDFMFCGLVEREKESTTEAFFFPCASWYHKLYLSAELSQAIHSLSGKLRAFIKQKLPADNTTVKAMALVVEMESTVVARVRLLKDKARLHKHAMDLAQRGGRLIEKTFAPETEAGGLIIRGMGTPSVDKILASFFRSSELVLDGLARIQIR